MSSRIVRNLGTALVLVLVLVLAAPSLAQTCSAPRTGWAISGG
jgi:hypothetical protein